MSKELTPKNRKKFSFLKKLKLNTFFPFLNQQENQNIFHEVFANKRTVPLKKVNVLRN